MKARQKILIADTDRENLLALEKTLSVCGADIIKAENCEQAFKAVLWHKIDLVVMNAKMPDMKGYKLAESLDSVDMIKNIPVIFLSSGNTDDKQILKAYKKRDINLVAKPFNADYLISKVNSFLNPCLPEKNDTQRTYLPTEKEKADALKKIKSGFLSNMSHELRTPMTGIMGFSELLVNSVQDKEHREYAELLHKSACRLMQTLNLILDISAIESQMYDLTLVDFNVISLTEEIICDFEKAADIKGLYIKAEPFDGKLIVKQDVNLLRQALINLINNSIKYTQRGGITVSFHKEFHNRNEYAVIKIKDTGIGIPADKLNIVFDDFRQAHEGPCRPYDGTGLGLSMAVKIMNILGGNVCIDKSTLGKGTTFKVTLPSAVKEITTLMKNTDRKNIPVLNSGELN